MTFYDPNISFQHLRFVFRSIEAISQLNLANVLDPQAIADYFPKSNIVQLANYSKLETEPVKYNYILLSHSQLSIKIYPCLVYNEYDLLKEILNRYLPLNEKLLLPSSELTEILSYAKTSVLDYIKLLQRIILRSLLCLIIMCVAQIYMQKINLLCCKDLAG